MVLALMPPHNCYFPHALPIYILICQLKRKFDELEAARMAMTTSVD